jgi:hypothetical protein
MDSSKEPDSISSTLASWRVEPPRNPEFRREVWARVGAASGMMPWRVFARHHLAAVSGALALAMAVGALSGHERARRRAEVESARLATAYVQGLDARSMQIP